jgi:metal-responsive CopG/Arc/MetJ family transcriptional regulator
MKTAISIPTPIFREAERAARRLGMSRSEFFTRAAEKMVASMRDEAITASYDAAFATSERPSDRVFRRRAARKLLALVEWDDE